MKKFALLFLTVFMAVGFTACEDDNNKGEAAETYSGFYTINGGNKSGKIPASLTQYDYSKGISTAPLEDAFYLKNSIALGDGAQQALVVNGEMYIVMYSSNLIWVVEPTTLKIITSIKPEGEAQNPRYLAAKDGKLYCTMYTGYVSEIDVTSHTIKRSVKVGPNPDQMAVSGNRLIVACSDGQNSKGAASNGVKYGNSCISIVDLNTFTESRLEGLDKVLNPELVASLNPTDVASNGTDAFVVCKGDYKNTLTPNTVIKISGNKVEKVCLGTLIAVSGDNLYVIYSQNAASLDDISYKVYDVNTLKEKGRIADQNSVPEAKISYPNCVAVDPVSGDIVMLSYILNDAGAAQYREPCYANIYDKAGNFKKRIECGVGARSVTFIHEKIVK